MRKFWPFMANFSWFGALALVIPLLVVRYADLGFGGVQIGLLVGLPPVITAVGATWWTSLADRTGRHARIWTGLALGAAALVGLLVWAESFWAVLALLLLFNVATSPFVPFIDTATMHMLGDEKEQYGRVRLGGTFGFAILAWVGGAVAEASAVTTSFLLGAGVLLVALVFFRRLEFGVAEPAPAAEEVGLLDMLKEARWLVFGVIGLAGGIGFALAAGFFYPYMEGVGAAASTIGLAIFVGTLSEVPVLLFGHRFLAVVRPYVLLVATVVFTGVRFIAMSFAGTVGVAMFWQLSHGLTFVLMWVAAVAHADARAPVGRKTTAQGLFAASSTGVGAAIGGFAAGPILAAWGADTLYLVGGIAITAIAAVAGAIGLRLERSAARSA